MKDDILLVKELHREFIYLLIRFINVMPALSLWAYGCRGDKRVAWLTCVFSSGGTDRICA